MFESSSLSAFAPEAKRGASARQVPPSRAVPNQRATADKPAFARGAKQRGTADKPAFALPVRIPAGALQLTQSRVCFGAGGLASIVAPRQHEAVVTEEPQLPT